MNTTKIRTGKSGICPSLAWRYETVLGPCVDYRCCANLTLRTTILQGYWRCTYSVTWLL